LPDEPTFTTAREEIEESILSGVISVENDDDDVRERIKHALSYCRADHFEGRNRTVWETVVAFYGLAGGAPDAKDFADVLASTTMPEPEQAEAVEHFKELAAVSVSIARFRFCCRRVVEMYRNDRYLAALTDASQIIHGTISVDGVALTGFKDSVGHLRHELGAIDIEETDDERQAGDLDEDTRDLANEYQNATQSEVGTLTGFAEVDELTHGAQAGEMWLFAGFTGEGKSKITYNISWHAAIKQQRNVLYGTAEATREQVRRNIAVRHSHEPQFDRPGGLRYNDIKWGSLSPDDEQVYASVLKDLRTGYREGRHGKLHIFTIPHKATMDYVAAVVERQSQLYPVEMLVVDYLGLMGSVNKRQSRREELDDLLIATKRLAVDLRIPIMSPWQISRDAWKEAQKSGGYDKASLSDTSQAEKSTDLIMSLLRSPDNAAQLICQILKYRDGEELNRFTLATDFTTSLVTTDAAGYSALDDD